MQKSRIFSSLLFQIFIFIEYRTSMLLIVPLSIDQIVRTTIRIVTRAHLSILTEQHVSQMQTASSSTLIISRSRTARVFHANAGKKNTNAPDFLPVAFAFSPRRWRAIWESRGGIFFSPSFPLEGVGVEARHNVAQCGATGVTASPAYAYFDWNSPTPLLAEPSKRQPLPRISFQTNMQIMRASRVRGPL